MQRDLSTSRYPLIIRILTMCGTFLVLFLYTVFLISSILLLYNMRFKQEILIGSHQLPQNDFGLFWCAGNSLADQLALRFQFTFSEIYRQTCQNDILSARSPIDQAWPYPPTMGFLIVPFALLPLKVGFWIWHVFCVLVSVFLLRRAGLDWRMIVLGLASPAAWHDFTNGQNGTLTGTLLLGSLLMAKDRPELAGICAGILTIKPHLGLPIVLVAIRLRAWKLVNYAVIIALALIVLATLLCGKNGWVWFFGTAQHDEWLWASSSFDRGFPGAGITVYFMVRSFGLSDHQAIVAQFLAAIAALCLIWRVWKPSKLAYTTRVIITICLNVWVVPHSFMYDLVAFSTVMGILIVKLSGWRCFMSWLLWLMAGYTGVISVMIIHVLCFPLLAAAGAALAWSARNESAFTKDSFSKTGISSKSWHKAT
jgi:alpha-1,2-mannosyltransferase